MYIRSNTEAAKEGYAARICKQPLSSNTFSYGTKRYWDWRDGWYSANDDEEMREG
jgi:hypothetical protein